MSFSVPRGPGNKPSLKPITVLNQNSLLNQLLDRKPAGSSTVLLESLVVGDVTINNTVNTALAKASNVTPGVSVPGKVLTVDSNKDISGINRLGLAQVEINGTLLDPSIFSGGASTVSTEDAARTELNGITPGVVTPNKAIVLDENKTVSGINSLAVEALETDGQILVNRKNNNVKIDTSLSMNSSMATSVNKSFSNLITSSFNMNVNGHPDTVYYSQTLDLYASRFDFDKTIKRSANGMAWETCLTDSNLSFMNFFPSTGLFVATAGNNIYYSSNLSTWQSTRASDKNFVCVEYSPKLQLYVAVVDNNSAPWFSYNLTKWYLCEGPSMTSLCLKWVGTRFLAGLNQGGTSLLAWSEDGQKWDILPTSSVTQLKSDFIEWAPEINTIVCGTYTNSSRNGRSGFYSKDGGATFKPIYIGGGIGTFTKVIWIPEMRVFIAVTSSNQTYGVSPDGINWKMYNLGSSANYISLLFEKKSSSVFLYGANSSTVNKILPGPLNNSTRSALWDRSSTGFSFNSSATTAAFNVGSNSKRIIKFTDATKTGYGEINLESNVLEFKSNIINMDTQTLVFPGTLPVQARDLLFFEQNEFPISVGGNINHTGYLHANVATVNGVNFDTSNTASVFQNNSVGAATASKLMIKHIDGSFSGAESVQTNSVRANQFRLSSASTTTDTVDLAALQIKDNSVGACSIFNSYSLSSTIWGGAVTAGDNPFYIKELDLLIVIRSTSIIYKSFNNYFGQTQSLIFTTSQLAGQFVSVTKVVYIKETGIIYYCTLSGLFLSTAKDIYSWRRANFMYNPPNSAIVEDIDYSPVLDLYVVTNVDGQLISKNGFDFKKIPDNRFASVPYSLIRVKWVPAWNLFVGLSRNRATNTTIFLTSEDGITWDHSNHRERSNIQRNNPDYDNLTYSPKLNMMITRSDVSARIYYTYNGKFWREARTNADLMIRNITWIPELEMFVARLNATGAAIFSYSYDGLQWIHAKQTTAITSATYSGFSTPLFVNSQNCIIIASTSGTGGVISINMSNANTSNVNPNNTVVHDNMSLDIQNNRVGLGVSNPAFSLHLGEDLAFKPSSATWITSSDERLKEDVVDADLSQCANAIESIPVKEFELQGKKQLGWIAQEVESVIPKAVTKVNMYGLSDCRALDNDQVVANLFGAVKWLMRLDADLDSEFFEM